MRGKGKEDWVNKQENSENWCFICKNGSSVLRICDYKQCLKTYHHFCLGKDESFLASGKKWDCARHKCLICHESSHLHCYTCTNSVCRDCLSTGEILQVKGKYGFCKPCLKLALLIEEKRTYDSDGGKVDFTDRETIEGLYLEYYMIVKENKGFELSDIYAAKEIAKVKKNHETGSGSEDFKEEDEEKLISDYDEPEVQKKKRGPDLEEDLGPSNPCKRQRKKGVEKKPGEKDDMQNNVPLKSCFASIVVENLKLVCLGRGLLKEMLKEAETFEEKVIGCFVRVKSDPNDCRSVSHQLVQVKGVRTVSIDETNTETVLLLSAMPYEICIPLVSDENITEEECDHLRNKVLAGEIERPTVDYLQQKVNNVHKDMTNLSIRKELKLLPHLIDLAYEKGSMRDMFEHLERKKKLQSQTEQSRLLENAPTVIAEVYEPECDSKGAKNDVKEEKKSRDGQISPERDQTVCEKLVLNEPQQGPTPDSEPEHSKAKGCEGSKIEVIDISSDDDEDDRKIGRFSANHDDELEKRDYDSDGDKVDFTDREMFEGLHMECYMIIKEDEGFELKDIYAAKERARAKKSHEGEAKSSSEDFEEDEEEEPLYDYIDLEVQIKKPKRSQKRSNEQKPVKLTQAKSSKKEFIGWASRALVEFLSSIGKSTDEKLSQHEVISIVNDYVKEKKLINPEKKRFIMCDTRLRSLFSEKMINKSRIHDLLEDHFAESHEESEDEDNVGSDSEEENIRTPNPCKRQRKTGEEKNSEKKDLENNIPLKSRFASIVAENLKLVYLGRGVLKEMLKEADTFEEKVTGCFVRVKPDPYDRRSKAHHLVQVKGVKISSVDENNTETVLLLSGIPNEICIPLVSDEGITEEEVEDLRKKVLAGEIERPTVEYLQQKVNDVHKDMTNLAIHKELRLLQNLIERANEKGWRRDMFEHLERKKKLQSQTEQSRLLENVPTVIADVYEPQQGPTTPDSELKHGKAKEFEESKVEVIAIPSDDKEEGKKAGCCVPTNDDDELENETWCMRGPEGVLHESVPLCVLRCWKECCPYAKFKVWRKDECEEESIPLSEALILAASKK